MSSDLYMLNTLNPAVYLPGRGRVRMGVRVPGPLPAAVRLFFTRVPAEDATAQERHDAPPPPEARQRQDVAEAKEPTKPKRTLGKRVRADLGSTPEPSPALVQSARVEGETED